VPRASRHGTHADVRYARRPVELPRTPDSSCTAQPPAHGSKSELYPSSWAEQCRFRTLVFALRRPELQMTCSCRSGTSSRGCLFKSHGGGLAKSLGGTLTPHHTAHARRWPCLAVAVSVFTPGKPEIRAHVTYHRFRDVIRPVELLNAHDRRRKAQRAAEGRSARASSQVVEWGCQSGRSRVVPGGRGSRAARSRATTRTGGSRGKARGCRRSRRAGAVGSTPGGEGGYIRLSLSRLPPVVANHRNVEN